MSRLDYSKWDHIEVSDDEDDTHPNIDTPSLFRWRHKARVERDEEFNRDKDQMNKEYKDFIARRQQLEEKTKKAEKDNDNNLAEYKAELKKMQREDEEWKKRFDEFNKREKKRPWNIDTICHEGKSKTIINKIEDKSESSDADMVDRMRQFVEKNEKDVKTYGMYSKAEDTERFLLSKPHLVCEETANHLVIWCIDLAVEEKLELMKFVSHQCIVMQFILELSKSLKRDPRDCIKPFFAKFKSQEPDYQAAFSAELEAFRTRINERAEVRIQEAMAKYEEEEKQKRLGPGGLDPIEVMESLPKAMQDCFSNKDIEKLQSVLAEMDPKEAEYHMKRCVDSGMWLVDANKSTADDEDDGAVYSSVGNDDDKNKAGDS